MINWKNKSIKNNAGFINKSIIITIIIIGFLIRLYGLNWDSGYYFHPDERSIYMRVDCMHKVLMSSLGYLDCVKSAPFDLTEPGFPSIQTFFSSDKSPLNPHWFPLGSAIIYLLLIFKMLLSPFISLGVYDLYLIGRSLSIIADIGSMVFIYIITKNIFGVRAALLSLVLFAFLPTSIQHSHYYRPEPFSVLFILASFWSMLKLYDKQSLKHYFLVGLCIGLALSFKISALSLGIPLSILFVMFVVSKIDSASITFQLHQVKLFTITGIVIASTYLVINPYAILDFEEFWEWNTREINIINTAGIVPYTIQYLNTPNFIYEFLQTTKWNIGILTGITLWVLFLSAIIYNFRYPKITEILLLVWGFAYFITIATVEVKFTRYMYPLIPIMIIIGSGYLFKVQHYLNQKKNFLHAVFPIVIAILATSSVLYGLAYTNIYTNDHSAVQASKWINENIPKGTKIINDNHWDESIPDIYGYQIKQIPIFESDTQDKGFNIAMDLSSSEYVIFYSNRTYNAIFNNSSQYPISASYYNSLFNGELGYSLVKSITQYPEILGIHFQHDTFSINNIPTPIGFPTDDGSGLYLNLGYGDNDIVNYDHPVVLIFENIQKYKPDRIYQTIYSGRTNYPSELSSMLTTEDRISNSNSGTWDTIFPKNLLVEKLPVLSWFILLEILTLLFLPISLIIFRGLPDKGFGINKLLSLFVIAYITWIFVYLNILTFTMSSIVLIVVILGAISIRVFYKNKNYIVTTIKNNIKIFVIEDLIFLSAFALFVLIRWFNPDLWHPYLGGEKPMDFAYLNAIIKSTTMPPYDPWFAGGYINYYYFGQFFIAVYIVLSGIVTEIAYNLAIPTLYAFTAILSFSIGYNIYSLYREKIHLNRSSLFAGFITLFLITLSGNFGILFQIIDNPSYLMNPTRFDWWGPSRMMEPQFSITEFPFWTFLFADLHAHLIALPFTILTILLGLNVCTHLLKQEKIYTRQFIASFLCFALILGSLSVINTWDYPIYLVISLFFIFIGLFTSLSLLQQTITKLILISITLTSISYLLYLPYHLDSTIYTSGFHLSNEQTNISDFLSIYGFFLFIFLSYFLLKTLNFYVSLSIPKNLIIPISIILISTIIVILSFTLYFGYFTVGIILILLIMLKLMIPDLYMNSLGNRYYLFPLFFILLSLGICIFVDIFTIDNDINRMNTVFKFYNQAWILFSIGSAFLLTILLESIKSKLILNNRIIRYFWIFLFGCFVINASLFAVFGTTSRVNNRFTTEFKSLNGMEFMKYATYTDTKAPLWESEMDGLDLNNDLEGIMWIRANIPGSPVIAEATTEPHRYMWGNRISIYTGNPTVIGWGWHQTQQRTSRESIEEINTRIQDVKVFFSTENKKLAQDIAEKYNIEYIYVGELEKIYYPKEGLDKFDFMIQQGFKKIYYKNGFSVYKIKKP